MFGKWKKNRILKRFVFSLPKDLNRRYGSKDYYSIGQLLSTIEDEGYSANFIGYAQVLVLSEEDAIVEIGDQSVYEAIRIELAETYFGGDIEFVAKPISKRGVSNDGYSSNGVTTESVGSD